MGFTSLLEERSDLICFQLIVEEKIVTMMHKETKSCALAVMSMFALFAFASCAKVTDEYASPNLACPKASNGEVEETKEDNSNEFNLASADTPFSLKTLDDKSQLEFSVQAISDEDGDMLSVWHDIPMLAGNATANDAENATMPYIVNFVVEIPRGTMGKRETMTKKEGNPIMFDTKDVEDAEGNVLYERPRYIAYGPYPVNYGAIPQTWENSMEPDPVTNIVGDNDPIDAFDIGSAVPPIGLVYEAKVLGALGLIDDNETDWKVM